MANPFGRGGYRDLTGERFGIFIVKKKLPNRVGKSGRAYIEWECLCDCGKTFSALSKQIKRKKSCGCTNLTSPLRRGIIPSNVKYSIRVYKQGAKRRGLEWQLDDDYAAKLLIDLCFYCGSPPNREVNFLPKSTVIMVNGIDRVNNDIGYLSSNCVPCCGFCQRAKWDLSRRDFEKWVERLRRYRDYLQSRAK